jgi:cobalamin transport system substrate-binding protein
MKSQRFRRRIAVCGACLLALLPGGAVAAGGEQPASQPPQRIVSLMPSLTETVCALGACGRLVGTDRYSNWPPPVRILPKLGGLDDTEIERVVSLHPDLVVTPASTRAADRLRSLGLTVLALEPQTWSDTRQAILTLARTLGDASAGPALVARIEARVAAAASRVPPRWRGASVYFEVAANPYAAGQASFVGELLARLGLVNIVAAGLGTFPQLNPEFVLQAQPALIMAGRRDLAGMSQRPGWTDLRALQRRQVCGFDPAVFDALIRPGPRLGEAADAIADCLAGLGTIRP